MSAKKRSDSNTAQLQLVYDGPEVKDGTLRVEDMIDALIGFGRAYNKIADIQNVPAKHYLRVTGIKKASADILITVSAQVDPTAVLGSVAEISKYAAGIVTAIIGFIQYKKHLKGAKPKSTQVTNHGTINIINAQNVTMEVPKREYDMYQAGLLDSDLHHLTRPLQEGSVDSVEFRDGNGDTIEGSIISAKEREYFSQSGESVTTTKDDVPLEGEMKSLNKDSNAGLFHLSTGRKVRYKLAGKHPQTLWRGFAYSGPVRVRCRVHLNEELDPVLLEIFHIERLQRNLFPEPPVPPKN